MSQSIPAAPGAGQIIIIKRGGGEEEGHHGGAWKIAFADFMTAMMAFFLVMWLTSVSDDATKKQIAQYFNPIKLNSAAPETLGLSDGKDTPQPTPASTPSAGEVKNGGNPNEKPMSGAASGGTEQALFRDPYAVLAEIAAEGGPGTQDGLAGVPNGTGLPGLNGGEAYRDPFDPTSWQLEPNVEAKAPTGTPIPPAEFEKPQTATVVASAVPPLPSARPAQGQAAAAPEMPQTTTVVELKAKPEPATDAVDAAAEKAKAGAAQTAEAKALQAEIEKSVAGQAPGSVPGVEVKAGANGITISLADSLTSGMFEIGSAKPTGDAVRLVDTIAKLLKERKGTVVIRGHTDSRPYAGVEYDNWRLSSARAQFAYYMLVRGGLDETRVESIEGVADREPKDPANPQSAVNRRIEILLKEPRP